MKCRDPCLFRTCAIHVFPISRWFVLLCGAQCSPLLVSEGARGPLRHTLHERSSRIARRHAGLQQGEMVAQQRFQVRSNRLQILAEEDLANSTFI